MTEYWVSKKQYWCKYCNIYIRDDAPSRRQHETGLKHQGNKERFIRDLYRNGNRAKIEKAEEAAEFARIEAAALGTGASSSRLSTLEALRQAQAASHKPRGASRPKDKFANYSSAADLGFQDEDTVKTAYEIEQELKGRAGEVGGWETVDYEPVGLSSTHDSAQGDQPEALASGSGGYKRKLGEYDIGDDEDHESFRIQPRKKDPYEEDDWDPRTAIKGKARVQIKVEDGKAVAMKREEGQALDRTAWTGRLQLAPASSTDSKVEDRVGLEKRENGGSVKREDGDSKVDITATAEAPEPAAQDVKPDITIEMGEAAQAPAARAGPGQVKASLVESALGTTPTEDTKPDLDTASSLFRRRRPPPNARKK